MKNLREKKKVQLATTHAALRQEKSFAQTQQRTGSFGFPYPVHHQYTQLCRPLCTTRHTAQSPGRSRFNEPGSRSTRLIVFTRLCICHPPILCLSRPGRAEKYVGPLRRCRELASVPVSLCTE